MKTLSRRTVFVVLAVVVIGVQRKFYPAVDSSALIAGLVTLGGWVIGDSINPADLPPGANKWFNLIKEPRFIAMLGGVLLSAFQMAGVPIDETMSMTVAGLITTWIVGASTRPDATPLKGITNGRKKPRR